MYLTVTAGPQGSWLQVWMHSIHDVGTHDINKIVNQLCMEVKIFHASVWVAYIHGCMLSVLGDAFVVVVVL